MVFFRVGGMLIMDIRLHDISPLLCLVCKKSDLKTYLDDIITPFHCTIANHLTSLIFLCACPRRPEPFKYHLSQ